MEIAMMAACGLDCRACVIRRAPFDAAATDKAMGWYLEQGWLAEGEGLPEVIARKMYCTGCLGDRGTHWSADWRILLCCVDDHGLTACSQFATFPCDRLVAWGAQNDAYAAALARLRALHAVGSSSHPS